MKTIEQIQGQIRELLKEVTPKTEKRIAKKITFLRDVIAVLETIKAESILVSLKKTDSLCKNLSVRAREIKTINDPTLRKAEM